MRAENKYSIPIRRTDYEKYNYLLAWKMDGQSFTSDAASRHRGFISIAINFSRYPELEPELFKHQLVWQLKEIDIE